MHTFSPSSIVTRVAPSPTGMFHVGTARTALFNYLYARKHGGRFLVRIEDTDKARSTKAYEEDILSGLALLGLQAGAVVRQSDRVARHSERLEELIKNGLAYISHEKAKDDAAREVDVIRLRNEGRKVTFTDEVRGEISFDTTELGDMVIARAIDDPLYHFAVVVDDADMGITHVIRGEDHISNTPRQILIQEALGIERPTYAHLPLILASDRSKMSKRKGAVAVCEYLADGYLPEALVNFLALIGWNEGIDKEIYSMDELINAFSLEHIQKGGAVFDIAKLKWINKEHRAHYTQSETCAYFTKGLPEEVATVFAQSPALQNDVSERYAVRKEFLEAVSVGEYAYLTHRPDIDPTLLVWKKDTAPPLHVAERLNTICGILSGVDSSMAFVRKTLEPLFLNLMEAEGKGNVLWPLRYALSGKERSPDPFVLLETLGKEESVARIQIARTVLMQKTSCDTP